MPRVLCGNVIWCSSHKRPRKATTGLPRATGNHGAEGGKPVCVCVCVWLVSAGAQTRTRQPGTRGVTTISHRDSSHSQGKVAPKEALALSAPPAEARG